MFLSAIIKAIVQDNGGCTKLGFWLINHNTGYGSHVSTRYQDIVYFKTTTAKERYGVAAHDKMVTKDDWANEWASNIIPSHYTAVWCTVYSGSPSHMPLWNGTTWAVKILSKIYIFYKLALYYTHMHNVYDIYNFL